MSGGYVKFWISRKSSCRQFYCRLRMSACFLHKNNLLLVNHLKGKLSNLKSRSWGIYVGNVYLQRRYKLIWSALWRVLFDDFWFFRPQSDKSQSKNLNQLTFAGLEVILQILRLGNHFAGFMATLHSLPRLVEHPV